jgi:hypothetical protein
MAEILIPPGANIRLGLVVPPLGISLYCTRCRQVFESDPAGISLDIGDKQYILMTPFAPQCCGITRQVVMIFRSNADAWAEIQRLMPQIEERGLGFLFPAPFASVGIPPDSNDWDGVHHSS